MNNKFVYDGKRIQPIYERKTYDYSSALLFEQYNLYEPISIYDNIHFDNSSLLLNMPPPDISKARNACCSKFAQMCINKIRSPVNSICWTPDGRRLLSGSNSGEITMWNGISFNFDTILQAHSYPIKSMVWSYSKDLLISSDSNGTVKYWNSSMNNIQVIQAHSQSVKDLSFSYNDSKFLTASDDSTIKIFDTLQCLQERVLQGHNWDIRKAKFHNSKSLIASGGKDNLLKLWDPRSEKALTTFHYHKNTILSLKFYKDNYLISGGKDQVIKMLDLRTMREVFTYKSIGDITSLETSDNLIINGNNFGEIIFWEPFVDKFIKKSDCKHENTVWDLELHPLNHVLGSGGADYQVRFWIRPRPWDDKENVIEDLIVEDSTFIPGL